MERLLPGARLSSRYRGQYRGTSLTRNWYPYRGTSPIRNSLPLQISSSAYGNMVVLGGGAVSYERGTPVTPFEEGKASAWREAVVQVSCERTKANAISPLPMLIIIIM